MLKHKAIYKKIADKYSLYFGDEIGMPKNYTSFWLTKDDWDEEKPAFIIEKIPAGKYLKTLYIMKIKNNSFVVDDIIDEIVKEYIEAREGEGVEWAIDFNYSKAGILI